MSRDVLVLFRDIVVLVEIERDRSLFSYRRHRRTFSNILDCNVHAHSNSVKVSEVRVSRPESVHFLASFDFTLFPLVFLLSRLSSVFPLSRRTFSYRDRLKFRWKSHFSLSNSKCAFEYWSLKLELRFRTFYTAIQVRKVRKKDT